MGKLPNAQGHRRNLQHENKATTENTAHLASGMFTASVSVPLYPMVLPTSQTNAKYCLDIKRVGQSEKTIACLCTLSHKNNQN